jgi:HK97 family phage major capsid protein
MPKGLATDYDAVAMFLFGDLRMGVVFGDRRGMTMMIDPYSLSSYQQVKIINSERFDINCHGVGTTTAAGPVVALTGSSA